MPHLRLVALVLAALAASCQSMSSGILSVEGRAVVIEDNDVDPSGLSEEDVDVSGYGAQAAFNTPVIDLLGALEWREFGDDDSPELALGVRRRMFEIGPLHPFVEVNLRYGTGLDNELDEDYAGWNAGVGALFDVSDIVFLSARLLYERTEIELPTGDADVDGLVGTLGVGINL